MDFDLRPVTADDKFGSMKSGAAEYAALKTFARKSALKYERANLARTYVIEDAEAKRVAAYITLVCSEVVSKERLFEGGDLTFPYDHYPAVKIGRLMVDERYRNGQGFGLGRKLVEFALGIARMEICPAVGCRFVVVDSKQGSIGFYERCGFRLVETDANKSRPEPVMFIDLHKAG